MILVFMAAAFSVAFLLSATLNQLSLVPWKRSAGKHWTERARKLFPARTAAALNVWLIAANIAISWQIFHGDAPGVWLGPALAAWIGAAMSGYAMDRQIWPGLPFKPWFGQFLLYAMFWQAGLLLTIVGVFVMPAWVGRRGLSPQRLPR